VDVNTHAPAGLRAELCAGQQSGRCERTRAQDIAPRKTASASHDGIASRTSSRRTPIQRTLYDETFSVAQASACVIFCPQSQPTQAEQAAEKLKTLSF
jgi:hypothetical protein